MKGIVKWFNYKKGYGFILSDGKDYFAHISECKNELKEGDEVKFKPDENKKGFVAKEVLKIE